MSSVGHIRKDTKVDVHNNFAVTYEIDPEHAHIVKELKSAAKVASRGEARTIVLALKFLEAAYIEQQTGKRPLILLDDVFGELDRHRQKRLMSEFVDNQIVMTSTGD